MKPKSCGGKYQRHYWEEKCSEGDAGIAAAFITSGFFHNYGLKVGQVF